MASSEVEIVNSALIKIGEATIADLDEDRKAARTAKRQYPLKRDQLLRSHRWNFAVKRASLAPEGTSPLFGFTNKFLLPETPDKCLRVIGLFDENELQRNYTASEVPFKIEGRFAHADDSELKIIYIAQITDVGQFDPTFSEALSYLLAIDLAYNLTSGLRRIATLREEFNEALRQARISNALEGTPEIFEASEWLDSRAIDVPPRIGPVVF